MAVVKKELVFPGSPGTELVREMTWLPEDGTRRQGKMAKTLVGAPVPFLINMGIT
jgi:hypothetical protein